MPYIFDKNRITIFKENIRTDENLQLLQTILNKVEPSREEVLGSISHLNNVLLNAAKKSFLHRKTLHKTKAKNYKKQNKTWFNKDCAEYRKVLRKYSRKLSTHSFDRNTLHLFQKYRMKYKRVCRKAEKQYRQFLTKQLENTELNDPNRFWDIISKMYNWGKEKHDQTDFLS